MTQWSGPNYIESAQLLANLAKRSPIAKNKGVYSKDSTIQWWRWLFILLGLTYLLNSRYLSALQVINRLTMHSGRARGIIDEQVIVSHTFLSTLEYLLDKSIVGPQNNWLACLQVSREDEGDYLNQYCQQSRLACQMSKMERMGGRRALLSMRYTMSLIRAPFSSIWYQRSRLLMKKQMRAVLQYMLIDK